MFFLKEMQNERKQIYEAQLNFLLHKWLYYFKSSIYSFFNCNIKFFLCIFNFTASDVKFN